MMCEQVQQSITHYNLINPGERGAVAFSGGNDSLCLLHLLSCLRETWALELEAIHIDHGLRADSSVDAMRAVQLAKTLGVPAVCLKADLNPRSQGNLQQRAREARLGLLEQWAQAHGMKWVALAHTATDQAETLIMRAIRGAGLRGLTGMDWRRGIFIRPLLRVGRQQVKAYLKDYRLEPVLDPSNATNRFFRNRVRHQIMPLLVQENPAVEAALCRLAENCREENAALDQMAQQILDRAMSSVAASSEAATCRSSLSLKAAPIKQGDADHLSHILDVEILQDLPPGMAKRVLRAAYEKVVGTIGLQQNHLNAMVRLVHGPQGAKTIDLPKICLERRYRDLIWTSRHPELSHVSLDPIEIAEPGTVHLSTGRTLTLVKLPNVHTGHNKERSMSINFALDATKN